MQLIHSIPPRSRVNVATLANIKQMIIIINILPLIFTPQDILCYFNPVDNVIKTLLFIWEEWLLKWRSCWKGVLSWIVVPFHHHTKQVYDEREGWSGKFMATPKKTFKALLLSLFSCDCVHSRLYQRDIVQTLISLSLFIHI